MRLSETQICVSERRICVLSPNTNLCFGTTDLCFVPEHKFVFWNDRFVFSLWCVVAVREAAAITCTWLNVVWPPQRPGDDRSPTLEGCVYGTPLQCGWGCTQPLVEWGSERNVVAWTRARLQKVCANTHKSKLITSAEKWYVNPLSGKRQWGIKKHKSVFSKHKFVFSKHKSTFPKDKSDFSKNKSEFQKNKFVFVLKSEFDISKHKFVFLKVGFVF